MKDIYNERYDYMLYIMNARRREKCGKCEMWKILIVNIDEEKYTGVYCIVLVFYFYNFSVCLSSIKCWGK